MAGSIGNEGDPEFQVAPMIDVLLVILIFFMTITSAQVLRVDASVQLPIAPNAQKPDHEESITLINVGNIDSKPRITVDERTFDNLEPLLSLLRSRVKHDPKHQARIRADRSLRVRDVNRVLDACAQAGISRLSYSTVNRD